jgi:hypothetical protein
MVNGTTQNWKRRTLAKRATGEQINQWHNTVTNAVLYEALTDNAQSLAQYIHWGASTKQNFSPNYQFAKLPLEVGTTWSGASVVTGIDAGGAPYTTDVTLTGKGIGTESIITPAGTFTALKVVINEDLTPRGGGASGQGVSTMWVAPGKCAYVKLVYTNTLGDSWTLELTDVTDTDPPPITNVDPVVGTACKFHFDHNGKPADLTWTSLTSSPSGSTSQWTDASNSVVAQTVLGNSNNAWSRDINVVDGGQLDATPSYQWVQLPLQVGTTPGWGGNNIAISGTGFIIDLNYAITVGGWENVNVPAGSYRAIKLSGSENYTLRNSGGITGTATYTSWFTPASYCGGVNFVYSNTDSNGGSAHASRQLIQEP